MGQPVEIYEYFAVIKFTAMKNQFQGPPMFNSNLASLHGLEHGGGGRRLGLLRHGLRLGHGLRQAAPGHVAGRGRGEEAGLEVLRLRDGPDGLGQRHLARLLDRLRLLLQELVMLPPQPEMEIE